MIAVDAVKAAILLFFVGYYLYYPPYRALYADHAIEPAWFVECTYAPDAAETTS